MPSPLVGIPLDVLVTLLIMAAALPIMFILFWWFLWVPKPAKTYCSAKLTKSDVNIEATDAGTLIFWRGKTEGPGLFRGKKGGVLSSEEQLSLFHRSPEEWINKRFVADRIGTWMSYSGQGIITNPQHLALLTANRILKSDAMLKGNIDLDITVLPPNIQESLKECYINLPGDNPAAEDGVEAPKTREQAILLEPRILYEANTKLIGHDILQYIQDKAYKEGYQDGEAPILKRALPLLFIMAILFLGLVMAFMGQQQQPPPVVP